MTAVSAGLRKVPGPALEASVTVRLPTVVAMLRASCRWTVISPVLVPATAVCGDDVNTSFVEPTGVGIDFGLSVPRHGPNTGVTV